MDYSDNSALAIKAKNGDAEALAKLVSQNGGLVRSIALRFTGRGTDTEDLIQIGTLGFIKAVRCFDESYKTALSTYAVPLIVGEIKRFLRDDGTVKVSRSAKRNYAVLLHKRDEIIASGGSEPTVSALAAMCGISEEDAVFALGAGSAVVSLDTAKDDDEPTLAELIGKDDTDAMIEKIALRDEIKKLPEMWRQIVALRFYKGLSQTKAAEILGLSQVKISREEQKIFTALRKAVG